jgi:hypothetical protein
VAGKERDARAVEEYRGAVTRGRSLLLLALPFALSACGSSSPSAFDAGADSGRDGPPPIDAPSEVMFVEASTADAPDAAGMVAGVTAFCNDTMTGLLADINACCSSADQQTGAYGTYLGLFSTVQQTCVSQFSASVAAGRAKFDSSAVPGCEQAIQAEYGPKLCWAQLTTGHNPGTLFSESACDGVMVGQQASGEPCAQDYECQSGLACVGETMSQDGHCQPPGMSGQTCGPGSCSSFCITDWGLGTHPACAAGLFCNGTCQPLYTNGQSCFGGIFSCASPDVCTDGTCAATFGGAGAPCQQWVDCQDGFYCAQAADGGAGRTCAAKGAAGAPCSEADACLGYCSIPDGGTTGTCVALCGSG